MKQFSILLGMLFIVSSHLYAQRISRTKLTQLQAETAKRSLLSEDDDFKANQPAATWNNESIVVLSQRTRFNYARNKSDAAKNIAGGVISALMIPFSMGTSMSGLSSRMQTSLMIEEAERKKVYIKDKFGQEQFSVLYFRLDEEGDAFAARIVKPDGKSDTIPFTDAVLVHNYNEVPSQFTAYTDMKPGRNYQPRYYKIALPNLEVKDVLEYEFVHKNLQRFYGLKSYKEYQPIYYFSNQSLPVENQVIEVVAAKDHFLGYRALKGAPGFKMSTRNEENVYRWSENHSEKFTDSRYVNEFVSMPGIKFQLIYAANRKQDFVWFKETDALERPLTEAEISAHAKTVWFEMAKLNETTVPVMNNQVGIDVAINNLKQKIKKIGINEESDAQYVRKIYFLIRSYSMNDYWSDFAFARVFSGLLEAKKIEHEIAVTTLNNRTSFADLAFNVEYAWAVKVGKDYFFNPDENNLPGEMLPAYAGNDCFTFSPDEKLNKGEPVFFKLPEADTLKNFTRDDITASIDTAAGALAISRKVTAGGNMKLELSDATLAMTPYFENDFRNYGGLMSFDDVPESQRDKLMEELREEKKKWLEAKPKYMQSEAEAEFGRGITKYNNFKLLQDGRSIKQQDLSYSEAFVLDDMVSYAGDDMLINLPALMGAQTLILPKERNRSADIDFVFPRRLQWNISFTVPAGYTVANLESLNRNTSSQTSVFSSAATLAGDKLNIEIVKQYNGRYYAARQWPEVLKFLDAAYEFSQSSVVLKKS